MGLNVSHNAWNGAYSSFMNWRRWVAGKVGIPLDLMQGFYDEKDNNPLTLLNYRYPEGNELDMASIRRIAKMFPLKWEAFKPSPLHILLYHSDCDGYINWSDCNRISSALYDIAENCLPVDAIENDMRERTLQFAKGCNDAFLMKKKLMFT